MWRRALARDPKWRIPSQYRRYTSTKPVIDIQNGTFYKHYPSSSNVATQSHNPPLFPNLSYTLSSNSNATTTTKPDQQQQYWSVISPSSIARTTFLQILAGQHICLPPTARRYPALTDAHVALQHAIKYVGFDAERGSGVGGTDMRGAYLSARYESRREETDFTVRDYLTGHTELNALEREETAGERGALSEVTEQLDLGRLLDMPVANLSNGQTRRARIAKALMERPEVLLLDGPFMGLDPRTLARLSGVLKKLAQRGQPRLVISLRPEDGVPEWISHAVVVDEHLKVLDQGHKEQVLENSKSFLKHGDSATETSNQVSRDGFPKNSPPLPKGEALVELNGVQVTYGNNTVLGAWQQPSAPSPGLWWNLHRGQRCGIFGPNGSGKTTMLSLITSDHPQTYGLPVKLFGRSRLPSPGLPGISVFDLQRKMGHSSPEVHAFFPKDLSLRRTLESAWGDAPLAKPALDDVARRRVDACLRWFARDLQPQEQQSKDDAEQDLSWAKDIRFAELAFSAQRLALFLRAIVHRPPLIILDEAFSGMDEAVRDRALAFLSQGEKSGSSGGQHVVEGLGEEQALLVISHAKEDVPGCVREWICLPEPGENKTPRMGELAGPLELNPRGWEEIWGSAGEETSK